MIPRRIVAPAGDAVLAHDTLDRLPPLRLPTLLNELCLKFLDRHRGR